MKSPILGASYLARSKNAAADRLVNLYPEQVSEGKEAGVLLQCPGTQLLVTVGTGPIRGAHVMGSLLYVVSGLKLYKVTTAWAATELGTVSGTGPVWMDNNGTQVFVSCNPNAYTYNANTTTFAQVTDPDFPGSSAAGYVDSYFIFIDPDSQKFYITASLDGTSVDPLDFASAEGSPDNLVSMIVDHREVWLFGDKSTEVWYNSGATDFPFSRMEGAFIEHGCAAAKSPAKLDNSTFWLGKDENGQGLVFRANGYTPARISTHAIEYAIAGYSTISDAIGYTYQEEGHSFYVLTFPTGNATWVYDVATGLWHERAYLSPTLGTFSRHRSNCHAFFNGKHVVGDYQNGNLYSLDLDVSTDNGSELKWLRSWRALMPGQNPLVRTTHHSLQLDCQAGIGSEAGSDPQVALRWSDDGGSTWSNEHYRSLGKQGEYGKRVIWRRLGGTKKLRDRVYEVSGSDAGRVAIVGAELDLTPNAS